MNHMTKATDHLPTEPAAPTLMDIIARASQDPNTDVGKLERLMTMAREVRADDAKAAYIRALVALKPKLPVIDRKGRIEVRAKTASGNRDGEIQQSTSFAKWEDIDAQITPLLNEHGFALTFRSGVTQDNRITVTGVLSHEQGHSEETTMTLPHDSTGSKNAVQAVGSSTSYGKRYTATLLLNIRTKGEDDDCAEGGKINAVSEEQAETLLGMLTRDNADVPSFCKYMGVPSILELPASAYTRAIEVINTRSQKAKAK